MPSTVTDFCNKYVAEIKDEGTEHVGADDSASKTNGCIWSVLYDRMKAKCGHECFERTYACLTPQSYCLRLGNEKGALAAGMQYLGDVSGMVDTSGVKTFKSADECDAYCLNATDTGIRTNFNSAPPPPSSPSPVAPFPAPPPPPSSKLDSASSKKKCDSKCVSRIGEGSTKGWTHLGPAGDSDASSDNCCGWAPAVIDIADQQLFAQRRAYGAGA